MNKVCDIKMINNAIAKVNELLKEEKNILERTNIEDIRAFYARNPHMENADSELALLHSQYLHELGKIFSQWVEKIFDKGNDLIPIGLAMMRFFASVSDCRPHITDAFDDDGTIVTYGVLKPNGSTLAIAWKEDSIVLHIGGYTESLRIETGKDIYVSNFRYIMGENWGAALAPILRPWMIKGEEDMEELPDLPEEKRRFTPPPCVGSPL